MRIAFAGTPEFARVQLAALLNTSHEIVVVYTQPDKQAGRGQHLHESPVKSLAVSHQLPLEQPTTLKFNHAIATLAQYQPDILIVSAFGMILPSTILSIPQYGCVNVHASLLPRWRGASPIQQALLAGDQETGITLMQMNEGLDTGNILVQRTCAIAPDETALSLHDKLAQLGAQILVESLDKLPAIESRPQDPQLATHAAKITKHEGLLDWHLEANTLERQIRAFYPWPIAFTTIDAQTLRIWQAKAVPLITTASPGMIVEHREEGIVVATGHGGLLITQAQLPGKKTLAFHEILKGHRLLFQIGNTFT